MKNCGFFYFINIVESFLFNHYEIINTLYFQLKYSQLLSIGKYSTENKMKQRILIRIAAKKKHKIRLAKQWANTELSD